MMHSAAAYASLSAPVELEYVPVFMDKSYTKSSDEYRLILQLRKLLSMLFSEGHVCESSAPYA